MSADAPTQTQASATKPPETQTQTQTVETKHEESQSASPPHTADYAPYPKLDPDDVVPPPLQQQEAPLNTESRAPISGDAATTMPKDSNPYVTPAPVAASSSKRNEQLANSKDAVNAVITTPGTQFGKSEATANCD
ncbi:GEM-like protein 1 [Vigna umbellata]|uniref:GEM-like protein 1 n=1 Tax=Vigna umbellata TaxID=87088 RepID=UPI001F5E90C3|nr:GEM-like protein 1 [Vigna umbellata]